MLGAGGWVPACASMCFRRDAAMSLHLLLTLLKKSDSAQLCVQLCVLCAVRRIPLPSLLPGNNIYHPCSTNAPPMLHPCSTTPTLTLTLHI